MATVVDSVTQSMTVHFSEDQGTGFRYHWLKIKTTIAMAARKPEMTQREKPGTIQINGLDNTPKREIQMKNLLKVYSN